MQPSFKRNIILIVESVIAFLILQTLHFFIGKYNSMILGLTFITFSALIFFTTYLFVKRTDKKDKILDLKIQAELSN